MPEETKQRFPKAAEKIVMVANLREGGEYRGCWLLINHDNSLMDKIESIRKLMNYDKWLAKGPKGHPLDSEIQALANLEMCELYGIKGNWYGPGHYGDWISAKHSCDFFPLRDAHNPQAQIYSRAQVYDVSSVVYFGTVKVPETPLFF